MTPFKSTTQRDGTVFVKVCADAHGRATVSFMQVHLRPTVGVNNAYDVLIGSSTASQAEENTKETVKSVQSGVDFQEATRILKKVEETALEEGWTVFTAAPQSRASAPAASVKTSRVNQLVPA